MKQNKDLKLIGAAIDACAGTVGSADMPDMIASQLNILGLNFFKILRYYGNGRDIEKLKEYFTTLALDVKDTLNTNKFPIIIGGDHSCAIGSWSGVAKYLLENNQSLGLIWLDAHIDAHTPDTTPSGNIHGMPVASLLGYGYSELTSILDKNPKVKPEHIILIGIRSYEPEEEELLKNLGVKIYYNHDLNKDGFEKIFRESWNELSSKVDKIGLSIDLDGFDPEFAPGVGTQEHDGIDFNDFMNSISKTKLDKLVSLEITEGNYHLDPSGKTVQCILDIVNGIVRK